MKPARATSVKRIAIYALAWLLVGSAINYAQAVVFATPYIQRQVRYEVGGRLDERLVIGHSALISNAWYTSDHELAKFFSQKSPVRPVRPSWLRIKPDPSLFAIQEQTVCGWPLRALTNWLEIPLPTSGLEFTRSYGLWQPTRNLDVSIIPLWPGFLVNALVWGFPVVLVPLVKGHRRARRERRGLCARCGYDLRSGSLTICPECGPPAPSPVA
jgi:hypothetical protein